MGFFDDVVSTVNNTIDQAGQFISRNTQDFSSLSNAGGAVKKVGAGYVAYVGGAITGVAGLLPQAQSVLTSKTANNLTAGYSGDYAGEQRSIGQLAHNETPNAENTSDSIRFGVKTGAIVGTYGAANAAFGGAAVSSEATAADSAEWAAADTTAVDQAEFAAADAGASSGSSYLGTIGGYAKTASGYASVAAGGKYLLSGDLKDAAKSFGIPDNLTGGLPGGSSPGSPGKPGSTTIYNPASPLTNPPTDSVSGIAGISSQQIAQYALPAALAVGAIFLLKRLK